MRKQQVLEKIDLAREDLLDAIEGLSADQMLIPGVTGDWCVKDILAHVTWWEEECLKFLPVIIEGCHPPRYSVAYGGINAFNALMTEKKRKLSLEEVMEEFNLTHQRLLTYLETIPEEQFTRETRFRRRLKYDTYLHYPEHAEAIRAWRKTL